MIISPLVCYFAVHTDMSGSSRCCLPQNKDGQHKCEKKLRVLKDGLLEAEKPLPELLQTVA